MVAVSVVIPVHNRVRTLARTVRSVISQTLSDWEVIVVDDGSSDGSAELAESFQGRDKRIRVIAQPHWGPGQARNLGARKSSGDFVYFLDSDDEILPNALEELLHKARNDSLDLLFFDPVARVHKRLSRKTRVLRSLLESRVSKGTDYLNQAVDAKCFRFSPCLQFVRREALEASGVTFPDHLVTEDAVYTTTMVLACDRVAYLQKSLFMRHLQSDSITKTAPNIEALRGALRSYEALATLRENLVEQGRNVVGLDKLMQRLWVFAQNQFDRMPRQARDALQERNLRLSQSGISSRFLEEARSMTLLRWSRRKLGIFAPARLL